MNVQTKRVRSGANVAGPDTAWTTPGNITASGGGVAQVNSYQSQYLYGSDCDFSLPVGAIIRQVDLIIHEVSTTYDVDAMQGHLTINGLTPYATEIFPAYVTPTIITVEFKGATIALITRAIVNGAVFGGLVNAAGVNVSVDYMDLAVHYSAPGDPDYNSPLILFLS